MNQRRVGASTCETTHRTFSFRKHDLHRPHTSNAYGRRIELDSIHGVHLVRWPHDADLRQRLARSGAPRLLLVASSERLDSQRDIDEYWLPDTSSYADLVAAADRLLTEIHEFDKVWPWVDEYGTVHRAHLAVPLTRPEAIVLKELLRNEGRVVPRSQLHRLLETTGSHGGRALEGTLYRLRLRLIGLRLAIRAARTQGFAIDVLGSIDVPV